MTFSESSSAFLVVSKAWLRVATPLLYNVVVIRSKAQAQALAATLNANPDLGRFIKKLRVEGGFAISMLKILQSSPNITDIFLSLSVAPSDNACGLCRGLPLIDPVRVIIDNYTWNGVNKPTSKLIDTLEKCFVTWKNMVHSSCCSFFHSRRCSI
jgi:DNA mismatch repair ATPase MutS